MPDIATEDDRKQVIRYIKALDLTRPWIVTVKRRTVRRSLSQNALFHMWCTEAGKEVGYDMDEAKYWIKAVCECPIHTIEIDGVKIAERSTSKLSTDEMREFMDRVFRRLVGDMGIFLTVPEEGLAA